LTLRRKTFFLISLILAVLVILLYFVAQSTLLRGYVQLEEQLVRASTTRVRNTFEAELARLSASAADWSYWDETYEFAQGKHAAYVAENLQDETLAFLGLDFIIILDLAGEVVAAKFLPQNGATAVAPSTLQAGQADQLIPATDDPLATVTGFALIHGQPAMIAARHILSSQVEGPRAGVLIFGFFFNEAEIASMSSQLNTVFQVHPLFDATLSAEHTAVVNQLNDSAEVIVAPINEDLIAGYALIKDINGTPIYLLQTTMTRDVYHQGLNSLRFLLANSLLVGFAFILLTLILIERLVLSRINALNQNVVTFQQTQQWSLPCPTAQGDEIDRLTSVLQQTLFDVTEARQTLEQVNRELEQRVAQRTAELADANRELLIEINQRRQTQEKLEQARDHAFEALRLKTRILANVSHDARTPLNVVTLRAEMLLYERYGPLNEKQKEQVNIVLLSAQRLLSFFNNLLEESQASSNQLKIRRQKFSPHKLVHDVELLLRPLAEQKGLALTAQVEANVPAQLCGDPERIKQVLSNLVDNAIKFTDQGEVRIRVYTEGNGYWSTAVTDTGSGINDSHRHLVFDAFWQADGSMTRKVNHGVGLGLSIVKNLTHLMGGVIQLESSPDKGSTFTITLPLLQETEELNE
jgi:signal transduction histidine kinase